nr:dihydrofolate reductase family protein [Lentzea terrae]
MLSPTIGRQLLERGLVDEIALHITPVILGHGLRFFDNPGWATDPPAPARHRRPPLGGGRPVSAGAGDRQPLTAPEARPCTRKRCTR